MLTQPNAPFRFYDADRPIYTHPRFLPGASLIDCSVRRGIIAEGSVIERATIEDSIVGIRASIQPGCTIRRSVLLGADYYATDGVAPNAPGPRLGIGRDVVLDGVIVDKNARIGDGVRLTNANRLDNFDGDGYYIRDGIVVVPKDGAVAAGTIV
jgi:glucose-1-phosphate adenylyltransferase